MAKNKSEKKKDPQSNPKQLESSEVTPLMEAVAMKAPVKSKIKKDFPPEQAKKIQAKLKQKEEEEFEAEMNEEVEKERREKIINIKRKAKELEHGNKSRIILFPSYSRKSDKLEWYKMGEFSALYYVHRMASRMGRTAKIMKDTDRFGKMSAIVSIRNVEKFLEDAMKLNEVKGYEETVDGMYIIELKRPLTDDEVGVLRKTERIQIDMMHNVLRPKKASPGVYQAIMMLARQVLPRANRLEGGYKTTAGLGLIDMMCELTQVYFEYAERLIDVDEARTKMLELTIRLRAMVVLLGEVHKMGYDVATSIGENIAKLTELVKEMK